MNHWKRTVFCGVLTAADVDKEVTLNGWAHRQRDFGDLVFIDLRDRTGLVQVVVDKSATPELVALANSVRSEFVLSVRGVVRKRRPGAENPNLTTGEIEIAVTGLDVLNASKPIPFQVSDESVMTLVDESKTERNRGRLSQMDGFVRSDVRDDLVFEWV